jgi:segregation and condensation protein A
LKKNQRSFPAKKAEITMPKFTPPKGIELNDLWDTFQNLLKDMPEELVREQIELPSEKITVEEKLAHLHEIFNKKKKHSFKHLIKNSTSKLEAIVVFLAVLEMVKCKKIRVIQSNNFADIELERR